MGQVGMRQAVRERMSNSRVQLGFSQIQDKAFHLLTALRRDEARDRHYFSNINTHCQHAHRWGAISEGYYGSDHQTSTLYMYGAWLLTCISSQCAMRLSLLPCIPITILTICKAVPSDTNIPCISRV